MKVTPEHYGQMKEAIKAVLTKLTDWTPPTDYSPMRIRWTLLHASGYDTRSIYKYGNDNHIDTALRLVMSDLERPEWAAK